MDYLEIFIGGSIFELEKELPQLKESRNAIMDRMYGVGWSYLRHHYCGVFEKDEEKLVKLIKENLIKLKNFGGICYLEEFTEYFSRFIGYCSTYFALLSERKSEENARIKYFNEKMNEIFFEVYNLK